MVWKTSCGNRGVFEVDLLISFLLVLVLFYMGAMALSIESSRVARTVSADSEISLKIARSYEVLSLLSEGRDNEVSLLGLHISQPVDVSLKVMDGYIYGGRSAGLCVQRAVYVKDLGEPGILEVC